MPRFEHEKKFGRLVGAVMGADFSGSATLLAVSVGTLLFVGFVALLIRYTRSAPAGKSKAAPKAAVQTTSSKAAPKEATHSTGKVSIPPPPFVDGGDEEEVTEETLAVTGTRPFLKEISSPSKSRKTYFLSATGVTAIGRSRDNDIVIAEDAASSHHCRIEKQGNTFTLIDLGSTNKTWVNGAEKDRVVLRNGDKVKIGDTTMVFALFGDRT